MNGTVPSTYFQEQDGVFRVGWLLNQNRIIFRPTPLGDVGIDGIAELVSDQGDPGPMIGVQIKSGRSYLRDGGDCWRYYQSEKHTKYWEMYPLPVLLMLHDPDSDEVYWTDVRMQLRNNPQASPLSVPKANVLADQTRNRLFESCGTSGVGILNPKSALLELVKTHNPAPSFPLSHLDLFLEGLTDLDRKLFFSAGMAWDLAETLVAEDMGVGFGSTEQDFLDRYLRFIAEQALVRVDYSDVLIDMRDRGLFPTLLMSLTSRGREVRALCRELGSCGSSHELTEASIEILRTPSRAQRTLANRSVAEKLRGYFRL